MVTCARCGKEVNSIVNCSGTPVCHGCCRSCFHYNNEISVLHCGEAAFFNQLMQAGINISNEGRISMANCIVVIPPYKPAYVAKAKTPEQVKELIYNKVGLKPKAFDCRIHKDNFKLIASAKTDRLSANEKAMSISDDDIKGTAVVAINCYGNYVGIKEKAAKKIADAINEFNKEEIVLDAGA